MDAKQIGGKLDDILEENVEAIKEFAEASPKILEKEPYPPELKNQVYVRTFDLKHGWQVAPAGKNSWNVTNNAENASGKRYGKYVVSRADQAPIHKSRWWFATDILGSQLKKVLSKAQQRMVKIWESK